MRLGKKQISSLDWVGKQIHEYKHGYSYLETSVGWGKPHEARVIASLRDKGLIICYDSGNGTGRVLRSIPNDGAFTAQMTELGFKVWEEKCGGVTA